MAPATSSCPTVVVDAPADTVWTLLTNPAGWPSFYDVRVMRIEPAGRATVGQRVFAESGPRWLHLPVMLTYTDIDPGMRSLELDVKMPLGLAVNEALSCSPISDRQCRVNYHCHFVLPRGWRGMLLKTFLRREIHEGPADSLRRLKDAAEQRFAAQG